jgi:hypothetical protein
MEIHAEDWGASYGSPYLIQPDDAGLLTTQLVEDGDRLEPHAPEQISGPHETLAFVDGVRRGDAALYQYEKANGRMARGVAGSHAAGAVLANGSDTPWFGAERVERLVIWGSGFTGELPPVRGGWEWKCRATADDSPEGPLNDLQRRMRLDEARLAEELFRDECLVVVDGPLHYVRELDNAVVGYVKTHHRALLPPEAHLKIAELRAGERSSLFTLGPERYSCYLRIASGSAIAGPWSGIVRLELPVSAGLSKAVEIIDRICGILPRYAGVPYTDPRAPQNLQPIGALERRLRHLMGDAGAAIRAVRESVMTLAKEVSA